MKPVLTWCADRIERLRGESAGDAKRYRAAYFRCYHLCAAALVALVALIYLANGRDIIWNSDGLEQYLPFFIYEGQWIRDLVAGIFSGHGFDPALWTWELGYGSDTLATLDVFWDPLNLVAALVPERFAEFAFSALVLVRMWLAGLTFSLYALYRGNGRFSTLCGALVYAFAAPALIGVFWPAGVAPLVLFPLLLLGAEKVLDGKRPALLVVSAALFFIVSYYFSYMACIFLVPYCIVRLFQKSERVTVGTFFLWLARFFAYLVVAALIAAVALVPGIMQLTSTERATTALASIPIIYSLQYYASLLGGLISSGQVGSDCYIGFGGLAFLGVVTLFSTKGERSLKVAFAILTAVLLVPFLGSALNGFNYATNRWLWAYDLCLAYCVVRAVPRLENSDAKLRRRLVASVVVLAAAIVLLKQSRTESAVAALACLIAFVGIVFLAGRISRDRWRASLGLVLACALGLNIFYFVHADEGGWAESAVPLGSAWTKLTDDSPNSLAKCVDDDTWWRYDADAAMRDAGIGSAWTRVYNDSVAQGLRGIDFYNSIYNNDIDRYHTELAIAGTDVNFMYANLGSRSMLEVLNNVKYLVTPVDVGVTPVYNYDDAANVAATGAPRGLGCAAYEGSSTLPLGYTYDAVIGRSAYESLTPYEKQEALMQAAVVDDGVAQNGTLETIEPASTARVIDAEVSSANGATVEDGAIVSSMPGATVTFAVDGLPSCETYLYVEGLTFDESSPRELVRPEDYEQMSWYRKAYLLLQDLDHVDANTYHLFARADNGSASRGIVNSIPSWHMFGGKDTWLLSLGYSSAAQTSVTITLPDAGRYSFKNLSFVCQPMAAFDEQVSALGNDTLQDLEWGNDRLSGTIDLDRAKRLFFSIPYSSGWTATVDGREATIDKTNTAFMSLELAPGHHEISLSYRAPGLIPGFVATVAGLVLFAAIVMYWRRKERRSAVEASNGPAEADTTLDGRNAADDGNVACDARPQHMDEATATDGAQTEELHG